MAYISTIKLLKDYIIALNKEKTTLIGSIELILKIKKTQEAISKQEVAKY